VYRHLISSLISRPPTSKRLSLKFHEMRACQKSVKSSPIVLHLCLYKPAPVDVFRQHVLAHPCIPIRAPILHNLRQLRAVYHRTRHRHGILPKSLCSARGNQRLQSGFKKPAKKLYPACFLLFSSRDAYLHLSTKAYALQQGDFSPVGHLFRFLHRLVVRTPPPSRRTHHQEAFRVLLYSLSETAPQGSAVCTRYRDGLYRLQGP
jgi:hypothetical protein